MTFTVNTLHGEHLLRTLDGLPWYASPWPDDWGLYPQEPVVIEWGGGWYSYVVLPQ